MKAFRTLSKAISFRNILMIILFFSVPIQNLNAESYEIKNVTETTFDLVISDLNLCFWTGKTVITVILNDNESSEYTVSDKNPTIKVYYHGKPGTNTVKTSAKVCGTTYGPYYRGSFTAPKLDAPTSVAATNNEIGQITLTWKNTTEYSLGLVYYEIKNADNNKVLATTSAVNTSYILKQDSENLLPGKDVRISMQTKFIFSFLERTSDPVAATGRIYGYEFQASRDKSECVTLSWIKNKDNLPEGYIIKRDGTAINGGSDISSSTDQVDDHDATPGKYYTYTIESNDYPSLTASAAGRRKPNGNIEGYIKTPLGLPVGGVEVRAVRLNSTDTIRCDYSGISSADDGRYVIDAVYYDPDGSDFKIFPVLEGHKFDPDTIRRSLNYNAYSTASNPVNFTDTTSLTISGFVLQEGCPVEGVSIMAVGETMPYETRADGSYDLVVSQPGVYTIQASKEGHYFEEKYENIEVLVNTSGINFTDTSKVHLSGYFSASCNTYIGTAVMRFFNDGACYEETVTTDENGYYEVDLPTNKYDMELISFVSADEDVLISSDVTTFFSSAVNIDLDKLAVNDTAEYDFIYRLPPLLSMHILNSYNNCDGSMMILEQNKDYNVVFNVEEIFNGTVCAVDTGYLIIQQDLTSDQIITDTLYFGREIDTVPLKIGIPNIISPYTNTMHVAAYIQGIESNVIDEEIIITGHRPREATFTTVAPSIPFLILHDPPGDGSYSFYEESSTYYNNISISGSLSTNIGTELKVSSGIKLIKGQFVLSESKFTAELSSSTNISYQFNSNSTWSTETVISEGYSTSSDPDIVGNGGDLYIGGALNIIYAITDVIDYNSETCKVDKYQTLALEPDGFATTFIYTENHISDVLIPSLEKIRDLSPSDEKLKYDKEIDVWEQIVENNHTNIENASFIENVSFSGGAEYTSSITEASSFTQHFSSSLSIENSVGLTTEFNESGTGAVIGGELSIGIETGLAGGFTNGSATTTGFTLTDDDEGDYQSVDIMTDQVYGTPAFKVVAATTSCPWEEGTQAREGVQLRANKYSETVEDPEGQAVFELQLGNTSESDEDNTYNLIFDATSNPYGAPVTIGGSAVVGNVPTPYYIPAGSSATASVTVSKPPNYNQAYNLRFILESTCDGNISDEVFLSVDFETDCGSITLTPDQAQPLITSNTENSTGITLSGYLKESIGSIDIDRRTEFGDWETIEVLTGEAIGETETALDLSFESAEDDIYYIRALVNCVDGMVPSEQYKVMVDRTAPSVTMVNPANLDSLAPGEVIYALFNEDIYLQNESDISVYNKTSAADIPFQYGVSFNKLLILPDHSTINDGDSIMITVDNIQDVYGNTTEAEYGAYWTFRIPETATLDDPAMDSDSDGIIDSEDSCPFSYDPFQEDFDLDGIGDACDDDIDDDGFLNEEDNCPYFKNAAQDDIDEDGIGDSCDEDIDGDGLLNGTDNCPYTFNDKQDDQDFDGIGNECDDDLDGDGYDNENDNCPYNANADQTDSDNDGIGDVCDGTGIAEGDCPLNGNVVAYPNPFRQTLHLSVYTEAGYETTIRIYDITGKNLVIQKDVMLLPGSNEVVVDTKGLQYGIYIYELSLADEVYIGKVVKE